MLYWNTYRMEIKTLGIANVVIAAGCKGTVGDGSCYFDEFVKYISPLWKIPTEQDGTTIGTKIGNDLDPDVDKAVQALDTAAYNSVTSADKLYPTVFKSPSGNPLAPLLQAVGESINSCRLHLSDDKLGQQFKNTQYCSSVIHQARLAEQDTSLVTEVKKFIDKQGTGIVSSCCVL